jgi:hypothetical protein
MKKKEKRKLNQETLNLQSHVRHLTEMHTQSTQDEMPIK